MHHAQLPNGQWTVDSGQWLGIAPPRRLGARTCWIGSAGVLEQPGVGNRVLGVVEEEEEKRREREEEEEAKKEEEE